MHAQILHANALHELLRMMKRPSAMQNAAEKRPSTQFSSILPSDQHYFIAREACIVSYC